MGYPNISHGTGVARRRCALLGGTLAVAAVALSVAGPAHAAGAPTAQLSFSPTTVSAGAQPQVTFISQDVPSGSVLYLEESPDGGQQWKTVDKTTSTQGTARLAALPEGAYEFKIVIADGKAVGASAPATLTVTGPGGAQPTPPPTPAAPAAAPTATAAPSGSGIPWLEIIVKPLWDAIAGGIIALLLSLF
jgi:hypothetical protein